MPDPSIIVNISAVVVSIFATGVSAWLIRSQHKAQRHSNYVGPLVDMLQEFRSLEFHRDYEFVCEELPKLSSERGISGLNDEAQRKVYAVGYFFQLYAILAQLGIIDRRFMGVLLRRRYVEVWNSLRPVVLRERQLRNLPDESILNWLEEFAAYAERLPADEIVRIRVKQHKRSSVRNTALNTRSATTDPALVE